MDTLAAVPITRSKIWTTLSAIDVKPFCTETEIVGDNVLTYLPWMKAHELMMSVFPEYTWEFTEDHRGRECHYFDDGSAEVRCRMTVGGQTNQTYLPIHRSGKAITSPSAMDVNTAKQRARVKALGEFGLGYRMWLHGKAKEDAVATPDAAPDEMIMVQSLWDSTAIDDSTDFEAANRLYSRYTKGLQNRGWTDTTGNWANLCKRNGWEDFA